MKQGTMYAQKSMAGGYGRTHATPAKGAKRNPLRGRKMPKGPKDLSPSHKGYVA